MEYQIAGVLTLLFTINSDVIALTGIKNIDKIIYSIIESGSITQDGKRLFAIPLSTQQACNLSKQKISKSLKRLADAKLIKSFKRNEQNGTWFGTLPADDKLIVEVAPTKKHEGRLYSLDDTEKIINYLNLQAGKNYRSTNRNTRMLLYKLAIKQHYTNSDFKKVIDLKVAQWKDNPKMNKYLRPQTLFSGNFEKYLDEALSVKVEEKQPEELSDEESWEG